MTISRAYLTPHPPLIIPSIGRGQEEQVSDTVNSMKIVSEEIAKDHPDTIIVITPHGPMFSDGIAVLYENEISGNFHQFGEQSYQYTRKNDIELIDELVSVMTEDYKLNGALIDEDAAEYFGTSHHLDHGTLVPLYYVDKKFRDYQVVSITYGLLSYQDLYKVGMSIRKAVEKLGRKVVLIASGDLSHKLKDSGPYDYHASGPAFDKEILDKLTHQKTIEILSMDPEFCDEAGECGKRSVDILLGALDGVDYNATLLSYEGPFGVGYAVVRFDQLNREKSSCLKEIEKSRNVFVEKMRAEESLYVQLAREVIEKYVVEGEKLNFKQSRYYLEDSLKSTRKGVFVSIKDSGGLRGCIGTYRATMDCVGLEIIHNAISAATRDPRFPVIGVEELDDLIITVDVLEKPEVVEDESELNPKIFGVIVTNDYKKGLLLPNLKGINTVDEQLRLARNKAGIEDGLPVQIKRFKVERHE